MEIWIYGTAVAVVAFIALRLVLRYWFPADT